MANGKLEGTPECVYGLFTAEINQNTVESLIQTLSKISQQGIPEVYLAFSTPGGMVADGINLYNFLLGAPFKLTIHNIGNVDSIGNAIFLAGDQRYACKHSTFMFHGVGININHQVGRIEKKQILEMLDGVNADQKRIGSIICEHTKISEKEVEGFFRETQTITAKLAHDRGVVHEIRKFSLPLGVPTFSFVFQR